MTIAITLAILEVFGLFAIGALALNSGYINDNEIDRWSKFVLDFLFPAYIFHSITSGLEVNRFIELWPLPLIGLGLVIYGMLSGILLRFGIFSNSRKIHRTFIHFCAVNNSVYLPIVIIRNVWGESMLANLFLFNLGTTLGVWTIGVGILRTAEKKDILKIRQLLTPNLAAIIIALIVAFSGIYKYFPEVIIRIISAAGSASVPVMLILIGASFAQSSAIRITWAVIYSTIVRLVILPTLAIIVLKALPISPDVFTVAVVVSLMPVAAASVIFTRRFGGSPSFAASTAILSTLATVVTVPIALWLIFGQTGK